MNTTLKIHQIVEKYGGDDRPALMRELKMLRSDIEYKALLKARKIVSPLFNISKLK